MSKLDLRLRDKWWRLTHLYKIKNKRGELVTFRPNPVQLGILASIPKWLRGKILKYRQGGVTTLFCILYLDDALWTPGFDAAIIAHEQAALDKIFGIVERAYENVPDEIKPKTRQDTLRMLRFKENYLGEPLDSSIYVALKLRGGTVQALHVSERAYVEGDKSQELEAGSKQAVPIGGRISEETTANGFNDFYDAFMEDYGHEPSGPLDGYAVFYAWHEHPEYTLPGTIEQYTPEDLALKAVVAHAYAGKQLTDGQLLWYRWKRKDLVKAARDKGDSIALNGDQLMKQEYPSTVLESFQSGKGNVFDTQRIEEAMTAVREPLESEGGLTVWLDPIPGHRYVIGSDPSDGMGADYGTVSVWDVETREQVAQYVGKLRPDELAEKIKVMAEKYNNAFAGVENNMFTTILMLVKIYSNYYTTVREDERTKKITKKIGWTTSGQSRDIMIDEFIIAFDEDDLKINSPITLSQMRTFVKKDNGKREHADGKHDDVLIGDMIAVQMFKHAPLPIKEEDIETAGDYDEMLVG